ncbi:hypothetical protein BDQ12DRAFT_643771 [Crucibulum laeve]|uniref:MYND-type domain-containing protein n=1 Tax=Crucibulum laeve TaxID=68775 RepID=A0A5C3MFE3_9AGAR|nr:hypothetical protein BDQ12DRAFT_643771 [Crucibulum laeve]
MAHPVLWPRKSFFYPIGNTSAVCLSQDHSPDEPLDILLLGCGDPRSILFTAHSELGSADRKIDYTCCDYEPATLARNVLMFTIIVDNDNTGTPTILWDIFYHFFLDKPAVDLLLRQSRKLIDLSTNLATWNACQYGHFLKYCTEDSLTEIRRHWILWVETSNFTVVQTKELEASFLSGMKTVRERHDGVAVLSSNRSAGPLCLGLGMAGARHFDHYWSTGLTAGSPSANATVINPTLAFSQSGRGFNVHYGTDPILGYHLAIAVAPIKGLKKRGSIGMTDLAQTAKTQFQAWCASFRKKVVELSSSSISIRYFVGDALAFSQALLACAQSGLTDTGIYTFPWGGSQINLATDCYGPGSQTSAPLFFNVIDTSNLIDHLGILNVLISTTPLLRPVASSILHTNALLRTTGPDEQSSLLERTCADIPTLSLLLGVVPTSYVSGFTSLCNTHEILASVLSKTSTTLSPQFHEAISWKMCPVVGSIDADPGGEPYAMFMLKFDPVQLSKFLFGLYLKMFSDENLASFLQDLSLHTLHKASVVHYTRTSFVAFLQYIKDRIIDTDWLQTVGRFLRFVEHDATLLVGSNNYQDLCCQMHLRGVHTVATMERDFCITHIKGSPGRLREWKDVPPFVCVVLEVARHHLKVLEDMHPDEILTPMLQCESRGPSFHNIHSNFKPIFGRIQTVGAHEHSQITIVEDPLGWDGRSPLIVSFYIPTWILTVAPNNTQLGLYIRSTPSYTRTLIPKLGFELEIFSAFSTDTQRVHIVPNHPHNANEIKNLQDMSYALRSGASPCAKKEILTVTLNSQAMMTSSIAIRLDVVNPAAKTALSNKAPVSTIQVSRFNMEVMIGRFRYTLSYPFSIHGDNSKLRIARKSSYVEVEVPLGTSNIPFELRPFPMTSNGIDLSLWNIHYTNLDALPFLDLRSQASFKGWLDVHLGTTLSDREKLAKESSNQADKGTLVNIKETLAIILVATTGINGFDRTRVFGLHHPTRGGFYTLLFANDLRLDLGSHTIVADMCLLPLTEPVVEKLQRYGMLYKLEAQGVRKIMTLDNEMIAWKYLLPALVERCRQWRHRDDCEYKSCGIPTSLDYDKSPIRSCGQGKNLGSFCDNKDWKDLAPFVTRMSLSPLFAVSYLDRICGAVLEEIEKDLKTVMSHGTESCAHCDGFGKPKLLLCSACKQVSYCSVSCQKAAWKTHKSDCKLYSK